jgi:signal transduction histidine kinase
MKELSDEALIRDLKKRFDQLKQTTSELQEANKKLEESESMKTHFIANISNEITNPFSSIMGLARNIANGKNIDREKINTMANHIFSEAFYLDFQLKNIFMAARLEAGEERLQICEVDIKSLLENTTEAYRIEAGKKEITINLVFDKDSYRGFKTDQEKLTLILSNLLSNAIKFSHKQGKIDVTVHIEDDILKVSVRDYGVGLTEKNKGVIFDRFRKLDSGINSINRGHGLGLSVNKALLDLLDGDIRIDTLAKQGSEFAIEIPEARADATGVSMIDNEVFFDEEDVEEF